MPRSPTMISVAVLVVILTVSKSSTAAAEPPFDMSSIIPPCRGRWSSTSSPPFDSLTAAADKLHSIGETSAAIDCLKHAAVLNPKIPGVWANIALFYRHLENLSEAVAYARYAYDITNPSIHGELHWRLASLVGEFYVLQERYSSALPFLRGAAHHSKSSFNAWRQLATVYHNLQETENWYEALENAVKAIPASLSNYEKAAAYVNLAGAKRERGLTNEALEYYNKAIYADRKEKRLPEARHNLAMMYHYELKDLDKAEKLYEEALRIKKDFAPSYEHLSKLNLAKGNSDDAITMLRRQLRSSANPPVEHYISLAEVYIAQRALSDAAGVLRQAMQAHPDHGRPHVMLSYVHTLEADFDAAYQVGMKGVELEPTSSDASTHSFLGQVEINRRQFDSAIQFFLRAYKLKPDMKTLAQLTYTRNRINDWTDFETNFEVIRHAIAKFDPQSAQQEIVSPMEMFTFPFTRIEQRDLAEIHARRIKARTRSWPAVRHKEGVQSVVDPRTGEPRRLRVGYLSSDFRQHPTGFLVLGTLFAHDVSKFNIFCYDTYAGTRNPDDRVTRQVREHAEQYTDVSNESAQDIAQRIADDEIDILVDLNGYYSEVRPEVIPLRPAPVQVQFMMFPATMGTYDVQYIVTDALSTPPWMEDDFAEWFMIAPRLYHINSHKVTNAKVYEDAIANPQTRSDHGLPEEEHMTVYCNFGQAFKITEPTLASWARILKRNLYSVLWLVEYPAAAQVHVREYLRREGLEDDRVIYAPRTGLDEHLSRIPVCDLFLDTHVCSSHTTAVDALWMGVPVLTIKGSTLAQRAGSSIVSAAGLPDLVMSTFAEYEAKAVELGRNRQHLTELRERIRRDAALFDTKLLVHDYEGLLEQAWEVHESVEGVNGMHLIGGKSESS